VAGVVLAAGSSTRMGCLKQLLPFRGKPLLAHVVASARDAGLLPVVVVLGHGADRVRREVDLTGTRVTINPDYRRGQSASLIRGLAALPPACPAALFLLGDQPLVTPGLIVRVLAGYRRTRAPVVVPTFRGRRGNPVLIDRSLFPRLGALSGDVGARGIFRECAGRIEWVPVEDRGTHLDVDTWQDYQDLMALETRFT
jgi:molybdenum cofactor cytidylyltransferase